MNPTPTTPTEEIPAMNEPTIRDLFCHLLGIADEAAERAERQASGAQYAERWMAAYTEYKRTVDHRQRVEEAHRSARAIIDGLRAAAEYSTHSYESVIAEAEEISAEIRSRVQRAGDAVQRAAWAADTRIDSPHPHI